MSSTPRTTRTQRAATMVVASAVAVGGSALVLGAQVGSASSHREAPLTSGDPAIDNTDTYAFVSPDNPDTTTLIANWYPNQVPTGGPNFYPWAEADEAAYYIKIDNDGDAVPDITYEWEFTTIDARGGVQYNEGMPQPADGSILYNNGPVNSFNDTTLLFKQTYTLTAIRESVDGVAPPVETVLLDGAPVAPSHVGDASFPDYQALRDEAVVPLALPGGLAGQSFVGQAEDSFFLDLRAFDLLYGGDLSQVGNDTLAPYNVNSVALQIPTELLLDSTVLYSQDPDGDGPEPAVDAPDPTIGVWSTTDRASVTTRDAAGATPSGAFVQVSRLGNPLVNELVIPANLKDAFNALAPADDASVTPAVNKVLNPELPYVLNAVYGLPVPATPRQDLFTVFLTGVEGLNQPLAATNTPSTQQPAELLRLNTSFEPTAEPSRLGVLGGDFAGFPNGRRLADDVTDIALQVVAGALDRDADGNITGTVTIVDALAAGDAVNENDVAFGAAFPYLALPISGSVVPEGATVPGPETTVTETVTSTATATATATAPRATTTVTTGAGAAGGNRPTGNTPRGGIDTGTADVGGVNAAGIALIGAAVAALGAGGYLAMSVRRRQEGSA